LSELPFLGNRVSVSLSAIANVESRLLDNFQKKIRSKPSKHIEFLREAKPRVGVVQMHGSS